jgi:hypothetical protein
MSYRKVENVALIQSYPDGNSLIAKDNAYYLRDLFGRNHILRTVPTKPGHFSTPTRYADSIVWVEDESVIVYDVVAGSSKLHEVTGNLMSIYEHGGRVYTIAVQPDGYYLICSLEGKPELCFRAVHYHVTWKDNMILYRAEKDLVRVVSLETGKCLISDDISSSLPVDLKLLPNGEIWMAGCYYTCDNLCHKCDGTSHIFHLICEGQVKANCDLCGEEYRKMPTLDAAKPVVCNCPKVKRWSSSTDYRWIAKTCKCGIVCSDHMGCKISSDLKTVWCRCCSKERVIPNGVTISTA